jgi:hypothetical protein
MACEAEDAVRSDSDRYRAFNDRTRVEMDFVDPDGFTSEVIKGKLVKEHFFELYSEADYSETLSLLSSENLRRRYRVAESAAFWAQDSTALDWLEQTFDVRRSRQDVSDRETYHLFGLYLFNREFERAKAFNDRLGLSVSSTIPDIDRSLTGPHDGIPLWVVDVDNRTLGLRRRSLPERAVVMTMDVRCGPSRRAIETILADESLREVFESRGWLLHGMSTAFDFDELLEWNRTNPRLEIVVANKISDWPENRSWITPSFHFFNDGRLVGYLTGWPGQEALEQAIAEYLN